MDALALSYNNVDAKKLWKGVIITTNCKAMYHVNKIGGMVVQWVSRISVTCGVITSASCTILYILTVTSVLFMRHLRSGQTVTSMCYRC